jgi:hypothetical protein
MSVDNFPVILREPCSNDTGEDGYLVLPTMPDDDQAVA